MGNLIPFPGEYTGITCDTFRKAFDRAEPILTEHGAMGNMNLSSIYTKLLQDTARFTERHADDILIDIENIQYLTDNTFCLEKEIDEIFIFGIRQDGVDGNIFTLSRCRDTAASRWPESGWRIYPQHVYRRILALNLRIYSHEADGTQLYAPHLDCILKDITNSLTWLSPSDQETNTESK